MDRRQTTPSATETSGTPARPRLRRCLKCKAHGETATGRGSHGLHSVRCPHRHCVCEECARVTLRRKCNVDSRRRVLHQAKDSDQGTASGTTQTHRERALSSGRSPTAASPRGSPSPAENAALPPESKTPEAPQRRRPSHYHARSVTGRCKRCSWHGVLRRPHVGRTCPFVPCRCSALCVANIAARAAKERWLKAAPRRPKAADDGGRKPGPSTGAASDEDADEAVRAASAGRDSVIVGWAPLGCTACSARFVLQEDLQDHVDEVHLQVLPLRRVKQLSQMLRDACETFTRSSATEGAFVQADALPGALSI